MGLLKRGNIWWYQFKFAGQRIRESAKTTSKEVAGRAERKRRRELEEGFLGLTKRVEPLPFAVASEKWLKLKEATLAPRSVLIEKTNLGHIKPVLGRILVSDIKPEDVSRYQQHRLGEGAWPKTVNLEVGTIRAVLRRNKVWPKAQRTNAFVRQRSGWRPAQGRAAR
jgi:hypothetical protein